MEATTNLLEWELPKEHWPEIAIIQRCHTEMKVYLPNTRKLKFTTAYIQISAFSVAFAYLRGTSAASGRCTKLHALTGLPIQVLHKDVDAILNMPRKQKYL